MKCGYLNCILMDGIGIGLWKLELKRIIERNFLLFNREHLKWNQYNYPN